MRFIFKSGILVLLLVFLWHSVANFLKEPQYKTIIDQFKTEVMTILDDHPKVLSTLESIQDGVDIVWDDLNKALHQTQNKQQQSEKIALDQPQAHIFSVHNFEIGDSKEDVEIKVGNAQRSTLNEYGVKWYTYHDNYQNFFMAAYNRNNKLAGLYTNQDLIASTLGIALGSAKETVLTQLGEPMKGIRKGLITYRTKNDGEYDTFQADNSFVTIFYDKHEHDTITAIQLISSELEQQKDNFYPEESTDLKEGFELQLFDLTNAARVEHGLPLLSWDEQVSGIARVHSRDMAENNYFNHTNLEGESPFDRMEKDNITFQAAGENLAAGQTSSIFAHEGLMNSLGHRENILHTNFESLGVGVAFDSESKPYFTENFITR